MAVTDSGATLKTKQQIPCGNDNKKSKTKGKLTYYRGLRPVASESESR